ncbi:alpha/beta fold hydrolase [Bdellovibrio reynosensis]|uniref:Alpha/beta hydrolase n=1 Tax=Bdellovibrio reynosensis TaxID=2835041 RepID=A0ABY4C9P9_9BACT|nr:alpha/beta hydrolase [Bdellovibrio reynosensis]UOF01688.1 alpha/beta hydrolase [Bdellovibrio reynosensis]
MQQHHPKNWLLLRGLARGVGHWGTFAEKIQERFPQDRFEFIDLPGNGTRNEEVSPTTIGDYVKDLRSRSEFVKKNEKFNVLAVSLGAMVTVEWMREFPHEINKAFLVCTSSSGFSPFYHRFQPINVVKSLRLLSSNQALIWENTILNMIVNSADRREAEMLGMVAYSDRYPVKMQNILRQLAAASQFRFPKEAPGDVRLIGSHGDRLVSPHCTLRIAHAWELKPHMHPWAGHDIPIDDPQWLLEQLL